LQRLAGGEVTADEFLTTMQAAWVTSGANGERWLP
jgi:hypothetical protein